jgi:hypothetical protein
MSFLSLWHAVASGCRWRTWLSNMEGNGNIFTEQLTTPQYKKLASYEIQHRALGLSGPCEHGNEHMGSMKVGGDFLTS